MKPTVLIYETESSLRKVMAASLEQFGLTTLQAADADAARQHMERSSPDLFVVELDHPGGENGQLIDAYRRESRGGAVVLTTTERPAELWRRRYQPEAVVYKPFDVRYLCSKVRGLIENAVPGEPSRVSEGAMDDANSR